MTVERNGGRWAIYNMPFPHTEFAADLDEARLALRRYLSRTGKNEAGQEYVQRSFSPRGVAVRHNMESQRARMSRSDRPRRLLMIAPAFYPCAASGAHRSGKFCKYLSELGYETVVVSLDGQAMGWPVDEDLLKQLPESTEIRRTFTPWSVRLKGVLRVMRTLARGPGLRKGGSKSQTSAGETRREGCRWWDKWLALPDRAIYWTPGAVAAALNPARRADVIYASSPPCSALIVGAILKRLTHRPLVLDFRDPWNSYVASGRQDRYATRFHERVNECLERWTVRSADAIVATTSAIASRYVRPDFGIDPSLLTVISNGYDSEDYVGVEPAPRAEGRVRLGYFGSVYAGRSPEPLFVAARRLLDTGTVSRQALEFVFYTSTPDLVVEEAQRAGVSDLVKMYPLVAHHEALRRMAACDVLIVLTSPQTRAAIPAKVFEYLPLQKPILVVAGPGATAGLMREHGFGIRVSPSDPDAAVSALRQLYDDIRAGRTEKYLASEYRCFSRRDLTRQLADLFDRVCAERG